MSSSFRHVVTTDAPTVPFLSPAAVHNGIIYCAGSLGTDPKTGKLVEGLIGARTIQALKNLEDVLVAAGSSLDKVLKVTVYVTNFDDTPAMNEAYMTMFKEPRPARACVEVRKLAYDTDIEIECVAFV